MGWKYSTILCVFASILIVDSQIAVEIEEPRFTRFLNRITNTTFDVIRNGVNLFGQTIDRIINTFSTIEERLRALLELFRKQLLKGVPELNIPVLDPLHIQRIDFNLNHEAAKLKGNAEDITIRHISEFVVNKEKLSDLGRLRFKLDLNLTFPYIKVNGTYKVDGLIGDTFIIHGNGPFWLNLIDLQIGISTILKFSLPARLRVEKIYLDVKLKKLQNNLDGLMNDSETGELFNKAISSLAPEALKIMWPEIKPSVEDQIKKYVNNILENATVVNLAKRLFNIG